MYSSLFPPVQNIRILTGRGEQAFTYSILKKFIKPIFLQSLGTIQHYLKQIQYYIDLDKFILFCLFRVTKIGEHNSKDSTSLCFLPSHLN